jgi:hypothetical protein
MKCAAVALVLALLAMPAAAQVEIRGLTIAPHHQPGNGGVMLKGVISTRLPGEISQLIAFGDEVYLRVDGENHRLLFANSELTVQRAPKPNWSRVTEIVAGGGPTDLDRDGKQEQVWFDRSPVRLVISRYEGNWREVASASGFFWNGATEVIDLTRLGKLQILTIGEKTNCLHVFGFADEVLTNIGSLSCGAPIIGTVVEADIDGDGRKDLIAARKPDRIEIFLR